VARNVHNVAGGHGGSSTFRTIKLDMQSALSDKTARGLATSLLREDHRKVRELFGEYERAVRENWDTRQSIAEEICMQIELHSRVEEEIFYPAIERLCVEFVADAQRRHHALDERIAHLKQQTTDNAQYDAAMRELHELFEPHAREEEQLFGMLEERVPEALGLLRAKIVRRKEQLAGSTQDMEGRS
jgi:hemerythrin HHE cation binding domain-containing protein